MRPPVATRRPRPGGANDPAHGVHRSAREVGEKDTKTHRQRRVVLDPETAAVLRDHHARAQARAAALGEPFNAEASVFSAGPDSLLPFNPDTATQRYPADGDTPLYQHDAEEPAALHRNRVDQWRCGRLPAGSATAAGERPP